MKIYNQFFEEELFVEIYEYAKKSIYRTITDNIYNFKKNHVQGSLKIRIEKVFREYNLIGNVDRLRVQCIDTSIKVAKNYHHHGEIYKKNLVCFLNEDFTGGEFEYKGENKEIVTPTSNTALIFGPELDHRVLPVTEGTRYTLVAFITENTYLTKEEKSII
jgi:hypothetical protein